MKPIEAETVDSLKNDTKPQMLVLTCLSLLLQFQPGHLSLTDEAYRGRNR